MSREEVLEEFSKKLLSWESEQALIREQRFRCSSLPICPLAYTLTEIVHSGKREEKENFGSLWFPAIGTIAHSALQHIGGDINLLYGDWSRSITKTKKINGKEYSRTFKKFQKSSFKPEGKDWQYEELVVYEPKTGLSGHVDGLVKYKDGFIVLDFKTSSLKKNEELKEPPYNYYNQIQAYAYLLNKYGAYDEDTKTFREPLKIYGTAILMIARDNPFDKKFGLKIFFNEDFDKSITIANLKNYKRAKKAIKTKKFDAVIEHRTCNCVEDTEGCEFAVLGCGIDADRVRKSIKDLIE